MGPDDQVTAYAAAVHAGRITAGPYVRAACRRHLLDLEDGHERGLIFDRGVAAHYLAFFPEVLRLAGGEHEGKPFDLHPSQAFIVGSLFGWLGADGYRRFRVAFIEEGKGNGKSPLAAGIGLLLLCADGEARAEVYAAAAKKDQAKVLFRDAVAMVEQSPELDKRLLMHGGAEKHNIAHIASGSFFRPISTEERGRGQSGPRPHGALLDEVHEHPTNAMVEFLRAGTKGRRQALILMITNSGSDRQSVCFEYHEYGAKVSAGDINDDGFFAYICGLDPGDDPFENEACWIKANPLLGVAIQPKYLQEQVREARNIPGKRNLVRRLNFCEWTETETAWMSRDAWDAVQVDALPSGRKTLYGALDLSGKLDLSACALASVDEHGTIDAEVALWTPKDTMGVREKRDRVPYSEWSRQGLVYAVPGKSIDYGFIAKWIGQKVVEGLIELAFDRWRIDDLLRELDAHDVQAYIATDDGQRGEGLKLVPFGQGFKDMAPALDMIEEKITAGTIRIKRNQALSWNAASAKVVEDPAGNRKFTKRKATGRIDGIVALTMAVTRAAARGEPEVSPYKSRGLRFL